MTLKISCYRAVWNPGLSLNLSVGSNVEVAGFRTILNNTSGYRVYNIYQGGDAPSRFNAHIDVSQTDGNPMLNDGVRLDPTGKSGFGLISNHDCRIQPVNSA